MSPVQKLHKAPMSSTSTGRSADNVEAIAALPLMHQPGEVWEYGLSTDVLGRVIEIVAGRSSARCCSSASSGRSA